MPASRRFDVGRGYEAVRRAEERLAGSACTFYLHLDLCKSSKKSDSHQFPVFCVVGNITRVFESLRIENECLLLQMVQNI